MNIFKANKANKGCLGGFSHNAKEESLFIQLVKQTGYDESRHLGSFKDGAKITIKMGIPEIGAMIDVLNRNVEWTTFHKTSSSSSSIKFAPYIVGDVQKGYGLTVSKLGSDNKAEFTWLLPINFGEASALKTYFDFVLRSIFATEYAEAKKEYKERQAQKTESSQNDKEEI